MAEESGKNSVEDGAKENWKDNWEGTLPMKVSFIASDQENEGNCLRNEKDSIPITIWGSIGGSMGMGERFLTLCKRIQSTGGGEEEGNEID